MTFFEPKRANKPQQDVSWQPQEIAATLKGASANPGSAVGYTKGGSGFSNQQQGFVGAARVA